MQPANRQAPTKAPVAAIPPVAKREKLTLAKITRGVIDDPYRIVLYGVEGVGKTTFAAGAPKPIFICAERGTSRMNVDRLAPAKWEEMIDAVDSLETEEHKYETVVVDTLDWAEPMATDFVCRRARVTSIHKIDGGYGKGFDALRDELRLLLSRIERLSLLKRMHVVLLAHAHRKRFNNPLGEDYDRYQLKLSEKSAEIMREWPEAVLFANHEDLTQKDRNDERHRAVSTGARFIYTEHYAASDAKNRYNLPPVLPLSWQDFEDAARAGQSPDGLKASIASLIPSFDDATQATVQAWLTKTGEDARALAEGLNKLKAKLAIKQNEADAQAQNQTAEEEVTS